jgi:hypothetical protein
MRSAAAADDGAHGTVGRVQSDELRHEVLEIRAEMLAEFSANEFLDLTATNRVPRMA